MGQVVSSAKFNREPIVQPSGFTARRGDVCRELSISNSTLYRWERVGLVWACDADHPDGQYIRLPSGRARFSLERLRALYVGKT